MCFFVSFVFSRISFELSYSDWFESGGICCVNVFVWLLENQITGELQSEHLIAMDRMRPRYAPQRSNQNTLNSEAPSSPGTSSPVVHHHHTRSGSLSNARKPQNTKAAAQRLAQVMAHQTTDDDEEEDDLLFDSASANLSAGIGLAGGRSARNRSPMVTTLSLLMLFAYFYLLLLDVYMRMHTSIQ